MGSLQDYCQEREKREADEKRTIPTPAEIMKAVNEADHHITPGLLERCRHYPSWAAERIVKLSNELAEERIKTQELTRDMEAISAHVLSAENKAGAAGLPVNRPGM